MLRPRAYTISRKNRTVGIVLLSAYSFSTAVSTIIMPVQLTLALRSARIQVQWFAQIYNRVRTLFRALISGAAYIRKISYINRCERPPSLLSCH